MRFRQHQDQARTATRRLLLLFLLTVVLTVAAVNLVLALLWQLQTGAMLDYPRWFFETNTVVAAGFILGGSWVETVQLRRGGAHVAQMLGGRELLVPADGYEQRLRNVVEEMAIASGLRPPRMFVLPRDDAINAFAAGWEQQDSVVAVTRGALERLSRDELQGVVAHELGHILHGDTRLNMRLIGHVWGLQLLFLLGRDLFGATDSRGRRSLMVLLGLGLMAVGSIGWLAGRLLKAAVSRQREFLADAVAVQFTRLPGGIGGALRKIAAQRQKGTDQLHSNRAEVVSHMLLSSDIFGVAGPLATHPPLAERIRRIFGRSMPPLDGEVLVMPSGSADVSGAGAAGFVDYEQAPPGAMPLEALEPDTTANPPAAVAAAPAVPAFVDSMLAIAWPHDLVPATLVLLAESDDEAGRATWHRQHPEISDARRDHLLRQVDAIDAAGRQLAFERLLVRCAALPRQQLDELRDHAHAIVRADGRLSLPELWRCLLLDHLLALRRESVLRETHALSLAQCGTAIATVSMALARQNGATARGGDGRAGDWSARVLADLELAAVVLPPDAKPASARQLAASVRQLRRLGVMLRPRLMKTWCSRVAAAWPDAPQPLWNTLRCLCLLIDTPMPPVLAGRFPSQPAPEPA